MKIIREYPNSFNLPKRVEGLSRIAHNIWWAWNPDGQRLFQFIDPMLWDAVNHNPVSFLRQMDRTRLNAALNNPLYLKQYDLTLAVFEKYVAGETTWFNTTYPKLTDKQIAYFSFEFGLHESCRSMRWIRHSFGDHLKEASDLGLPLTAIGFIYSQGYFVQHISEDGWQETRTRITACWRDADHCPAG